MIAVVINGEPRELPAGLNVFEMLSHFGIVANRVAIERNHDILSRAQWQQTPVEANDSYEIVQFVGGG